MSYDCVVIGASAGGLRAVERLLGEIPASEILVPLVLVLHLPKSLKVDFTSVLCKKSTLKVLESLEKQRPLAGGLYVAPAGYHLLFENDGTFALSVDEPVNWARPSIDVLFETAAHTFGERLIGVVLTGANSDGALGLQAIKRSGGLAIVQDPETADVPTMPEAALEACAPDYLLSPEDIGRLLSLRALAPTDLRELEHV